MAQSAGSMPWNPDATSFPSRKDLVKIDDAPEGAAWVWGKDDNLGRINLLTPSRVKAASKEIQSGEIVCMNLPLNVPVKPSFDRLPFHHEVVTLAPDLAFDDVYHMNTQSGTQWDGFRHFSHFATGNFYNGCKAADIAGPKANLKSSIHHWAEHGIAGRGWLIDYWSYAEKTGQTYDCYAKNKITFDMLNAAGKDQGIDIRPAAQGGDIQIGDMLFIRSGWTQKYYSLSPEERIAMADRTHSHGPDNQQTFTGLAQEEKMLDWLHDSYIVAVGGDSPSFEAWPSAESYHLHEYMLAFWGAPIGEMVDLEALAKMCKEKGRWSFFFTAAPFNMPGGIASYVNGQAIF